MRERPGPAQLKHIGELTGMASMHERLVQEDPDLVSPTCSNTTSVRRRRSLLMSNAEQNSRYTLYVILGARKAFFFKKKIPCQMFSCSSVKRECGVQKKNWPSRQDGHISCVHGVLMNCTLYNISVIPHFSNNKKT